VGYSIMYGGEIFLTGIEGGDTLVKDALASSAENGFDGDSVYAQPEVISAAERVQKADGILLSVPIYNYDANAAAKNLIELTGKSWEDKVVGFLCAAGGHSSYMSIMSLANSLMLDFRCIVLPRFVYATGESFEGENLTDPEIEKRIQELTSQLIKIALSLKTN